MILIAVNSPNIRFRANGFDNFKIDSGVVPSFSTSIFKSKFPDAFLNDGLKRSITEITTKIIIIAIEATSLWSAPNAKPTAIAKKIYASSSGSLIGVLNRTIESAPTKPRESASEDFTTEMTNRVVRQMMGRTKPRSLLRKRF